MIVNTVFAEELYPNSNGLAIVGPCSGAVVKKIDSKETDFVLILTNGHCLDQRWLLNKSEPYLRPFEVISNLKAKDIIELPYITLSSGTSTHVVSLAEIIYATMTGTDVAMIKLSLTYADLKNLGIQPKIYDPNVNFLNESIRIHSSQYNRIQNCKIIDTVDLNEGDYSTRQALKLSKECAIYEGFSGSAFLIGNYIVGLANTHFSNSGPKCSLGNPCEVSKDGTKKTSHAGQTYGISISSIEAHLWP